MAKKETLPPQEEKEVVAEIAEDMLEEDDFSEAEELANNGILADESIGQGAEEAEVAETNKEAAAEANVEELTAEVAPTEEKPKRRGRKPKAAAESEPEVKSETPSEAASKPEKADAEKAEDYRQRAKESRKRAQEAELIRQERERFYAGWSGIESAMRRKTYLRGMIAGVEEKDLSGTAASKLKTGVFVSVIYDEIFKILIPFDQLYREFPIDMQTVDLSTEAGIAAFARRQKAMAEKLYGLETPFMVTHMDAGEGRLGATSDYAIFASRAEALEIIERANFVPDRSGNVEMEEGSLVQAIITSTSDYSIAVNVGGVDTRIPVRNLTYRYISGPDDIRRMYEVGQRITVQIASVKTNEDGTHDVEVTPRPVELMTAKSRQGSLLRVTDQCVGTVTGIYASKNSPGKIIVSLYLEKYGMPAMSNAFAPSKMGDYPQPGDQIRVTVAGFGDNGMVYVHCRGFHGARSV